MVKEMRVEHLIPLMTLILRPLTVFNVLFTPFTAVDLNDQIIDFF